MMLLSCKKESAAPVPQGPGTIAQKINSTPKLSLLKAAATKAGLMSVLDGSGPVTAFAPTDEAFAASGISAASLSALTAEEAKVLVLYHLMGLKVVSTQFPAGPNAKIISAGGDSLFVTRNATGIYLNGAKVDSTDLTLSNGMVHLISRVLLPPAGNIVQVFSLNDQYSFLAAAFSRARSGTTSVTRILSGGALYTFFAPTNDAFKAAGYASIDAINAADPNILGQILKYHAVPGRLFTSDLVSGDATTLDGRKLTVSVASGVYAVKGGGNSEAINISLTNMMANNGVIHVVNKLLLP